MLIALCSLKGSPGVTTTAVGMAMWWPDDKRVVVVECDPAGGDLLARFRMDPAARGLMTLAVAARRASNPDLLWQHAERLLDDLPVVAGPVGAEQAHVTLTEIVHRSPSVLRVAADQPNTVVVADCGRVDPGSPALPIIRSADVLLLLARARDDQLAHFSQKLDTAARWNRNPHFVLVGDGYATDEVSDALGIRVTARIPDDPRAAATLAGHLRAGRNVSRSALGRAMGKLARLTVHRAGAAHSADIPATRPSADAEPARAQNPQPVTANGARP